MGGGGGHHEPAPVTWCNVTDPGSHAPCHSIDYSGPKLHWSMVKLPLTFCCFFLLIAAQKAFLTWVKTEPKQQYSKKDQPASETARKAFSWMNSLPESCWTIMIGLIIGL